MFLFLCFMLSSVASGFFIHLIDKEIKRIEANETSRIKNSIKEISDSVDKRQIVFRKAFEQKEKSLEEKSQKVIESKVQEIERLYGEKKKKEAIRFKEKKEELDKKFYADLGKAKRIRI